MNRHEARSFINALKSLRDSATDAQASSAVDIFPTLKGDGALIKAGTRIRWNGAVKRAAVDLWDREENDPNDAPNLWEDITYRDGYRIIPEVITVGTAFAKDECGWWKENLYKSKIPSNVYTPDTYPAGWEKIK